MNMYLARDPEAVARFKADWVNPDLPLPKLLDKYNAAPPYRVAAYSRLRVWAKRLGLPTKRPAKIMTLVEKRGPEHIAGFKRDWVDAEIPLADLVRKYGKRPTLWAMAKRMGLPTRRGVQRSLRLDPVVAAAIRKLLREKGSIITTTEIMNRCECSRWHVNQVRNELQIFSPRSTRRNRHTVLSGYTPETENACVAAGA